MHRMAMKLIYMPVLKYYNPPPPPAPKSSQKFNVNMKTKNWIKLCTEYIIRTRKVTEMVKTNTLLMINMKTYGLHGHSKM